MVDKSIEELRETELKPFKIAIENGIDMIMTAHIQFPQIEKDTFISKKMEAKYQFQPHYQMIL